jgi:hypothetical protein
MKYVFSIIVILLSTLIFIGCNNKSKNKYSSHQTEEINFGELKKEKNSILDIDRIVQLEISDSTILGTINQVEVFNDKLYVLDDNYLFEFSLYGKFLRKLNKKGNGPGEFLMLHSFFIDHEGHLYLYDPIGGRLLDYGIKHFNYIQNIKMPYLSPFSFIKDPNSNLFIYYYNIRPYDNLNKHIIKSNKEGIIKNELLYGVKSGELMHGDPRNIYCLNESVRFYPNFSNKIYELTNDDTLTTKYRLNFGPHSFPISKFFKGFDDEMSLMKELIAGNSNWIRLMYVYETSKDLTIKYYIKREFYIAYWDKEKNKKLHFKASEIEDNLGIGGSFPFPIGRFNDKLIGILYPYMMDINQIQKSNLENLNKNNLESQNPILVFYRIDI